MSFSIADQYYVKALDNYPYEIENVVENLNYALSYDADHAHSNHLMACIYMYILKQYKLATEYFDQAMIGDLNYPDTYKNYSKLMIWMGEYDRAEKLIAYGLKVKGMDRKALLINRATIYELKGEYAKAKKVLKDVKMYCLDTSASTYIDGELTRIKNKIKNTKRNKISAKGKYVSTKKEE